MGGADPIEHPIVVHQHPRAEPAGEDDDLR